MCAPHPRWEWRGSLSVRPPWPVGHRVPTPSSGLWGRICDPVTGLVRRRIPKGPFSSQMKHTLRSLPHPPTQKPHAKAPTRPENSWRCQQGPRAQPQVSPPTPTPTPCPSSQDFILDTKGPGKNQLATSLLPLRSDSIPYPHPIAEGPPLSPAGPLGWPLGRGAGLQLHPGPHPGPGPLCSSSALPSPQ